MPEIQQTPTNESSSVQANTLATGRGITIGWKIKAGLIATVVISIFVGLYLLFFFWPHLIAGKGMEDWSKRAGATPIECMIQDTNTDGYVSCSAMLRGEVVPLECGGSIFNIGCRVNYGAAAAPVRSSNQTNTRLTK